MYSPFFSKLSKGTLPLYDVFADGNAGEADGLALADSESAISTGGCTVRAHADNTVRAHADNTVRAHADNTATRPTPPAPSAVRRLKAMGLEAELVISSLLVKSTDKEE